MQLKRAVITGMGAIAPGAQNVAEWLAVIEQQRSAVRLMEGWERYRGLRSLVAAPAELKNEREIPRQSRRSMGRMSIFAVQAAQQALTDGGVGPAVRRPGRMGCVIGSTTGSAITLNEVFENLLPDRDLTKLTSMQFFHCISHTAAMNVAQYLGIDGYVLATSAACASALQAVGAGYDLIRLGKQDLVLCGGAEELHPTVTCSFDVLFATSTRYNQTPAKTPRPFDRERDGLVCGEGSGILLLEDYEHAVRRGARIYAEIVGYHTCGGNAHISESNRDAMVTCMREALRSGGVAPEEVDYINAHATATLQGDKEEAEAIRAVCGNSVPVSSLKGHIGHTLGASAAIELIAALAMLDRGVIYPTHNLEHVAADCEGIDHVLQPRRKDLRVLMKNSFAFGGISAALVCRKI
jgi:3-oxoacyl-[acyl-carrier-protein] synthase II